ncbi:MAG TPA: 30S ribosomal protein S2 [Patescibacteria group bacterium]
MPEIPSMTEMLKAGVHFGHKASKRYPKMEPYIYTVRSGIHIINLEKTTAKLKEALGFVTETVAKGGTVLFLGTKKQARDIIKKYAVDCQMPYISERWLGGLITNFPVVVKVIKKYNKMKADRQAGAYAKYTKKEQLEFDREIERLDRMVGGLASLTKIPEIIYIVDIRNENTAVAEANNKKVPIVAICDTNVNPEKVSYPIPANDDSIGSIEMITRLISEAVKEGQKQSTVSSQQPTGKEQEIVSPAGNASGTGSQPAQPAEKKEAAKPAEKTTIKE